MSAACREPCCSLAARFTVTELFERGFRRNRAAPLAVEGEAIRDAEGNEARFSLELAQGRIAALSFRATTCATLIAYCELLAETLAGSDPDFAAAITADELIAALPGVPAHRQERAVLAIAALRAVLAVAALRAALRAADDRRQRTDDGQW